MPVAPGAAKVMLHEPLLMVAEPMISPLRVRVAKAPSPLVAFTVNEVALVLIEAAWVTFMSVGVAVRTIRVGSPKRFQVIYVPKAWLLLVPY